MRTMKCPTLFIAQFAGNDAPFNSKSTIAKANWLMIMRDGIRYKVPDAWAPRYFDRTRYIKKPVTK